MLQPISANWWRAFLFITDWGDVKSFKGRKNVFPPRTKWVDENQSKWMLMRVCVTSNRVPRLPFLFFSLIKTKHPLFTVLAPVAKVPFSLCLCIIISEYVKLANQLITSSYWSNVINAIRWFHEWGKFSEKDLMLAINWMLEKFSFIEGDEWERKKRKSNFPC